MGAWEREGEGTSSRGGGRWGRTKHRLVGSLDLSSTLAPNKRNVSTDFFSRHIWFPPLWRLWIVTSWPVGQVQSCILHYFCYYCTRRTREASKGEGRIAPRRGGVCAGLLGRAERSTPQTVKLVPRQSPASCSRQISTSVECDQAPGALRRWQWHCSLCLKQPCCLP